MSEPTRESGQRIAAIYKLDKKHVDLTKEKYPERNVVYIYPVEGLNACLSAFILSLIHASIHIRVSELRLAGALMLPAQSA